VGVRLDAGRDAHQHALRRAGGDLLEPVDLVERVDHDVADAGGHRLGELGRALVVPVHVDPLGREAGGKREVELATRRDVAGKALVTEQPQRRRARKRLARVEHFGGGAECRPGRPRRARMSSSA